MFRIHDAMRIKQKQDQQSKPERVAIYAKYTSHLQGQRSLEDQVRRCQDAATLNGWTVLDECIRCDEAGLGRFKVGRGGLYELVELAEQPFCPFDGIVMENTSRLGWSLSDTLPLTDRLKSANVFLYFVDHDLDSRDPHFRTGLILFGQQDEQRYSDLGVTLLRKQMIDA